MIVQKRSVWIFWIFIVFCVVYLIQFYGLSSVGNIFFSPIVQKTLPYALSITDLTFLAVQEQNIYRGLVNYSSTSEELQSVIRKYVNDYEESSLRELEDLPENTDALEKATAIASNALTAYRMIRRFANYFPKIQMNIKINNENSLIHELSKISDAYGLPINLDHTEAMEAVLRLHYFYNLNIFKFSAGDIMGTQTKVSLTTQQSLEIANYALSKEYFTLAMDWINATMLKLQIENGTDLNAKQNAKDAYDRIVNLHDEDYNEKKAKGHKYIFSERLQDNWISATMKSINQKKYAGDKDPFNRISAHYNTMALCNGENFQSEKVRSQLYCWYDTQSNAYWIINPLKKELLNSNPDIVQIYDVIGNKWISYLKKIAIPQLKKAPEGTGSRKNLRTATYAWLNDESIPETPLSRRIELITGLNVQGDTASEYLQIAAYAFGGHVSPHLDSLPENDVTVQENGNRVTTFLIYLNEVAKGGRTVFPSLGTSVVPVKGSAVLWYTSLKNGSVDRRLLHSACPVFGQKWIATKWTNLNPNFLKRPCTTNPLE